MSLTVSRRPRVMRVSSRRIDQERHVLQPSRGTESPAARGVPKQKARGTKTRTLVEARADALRTYHSKRVTHIELDHRRLADNVRRVREHIGERVKLCAVVKANGYGHGAVEVARVALLHGANELAVATVAEGVELRRAGIEAPILVLGYSAPEEAEAIVACDLTATVMSEDGAAALARAAAALGVRARIHVKVNTGMNRLGVKPEDAVSLVEKLRRERHLDVEGLFTHFHSADCDEAASRAQLASFTRVVDELTKKGLRPRTVHAAASDTLMAFPEAHFDMVRPGTALYGLMPGFRPVLSWKTAVAHVNHLEAGETVSYGATWTAPGPSDVAVIPVGWADGLAAGASRFSHVLVGGVRCPVVGSITMDQAMVDVTALRARGVKVGDEVVLIGTQGEDEITAAEAAHWLGDVHPVVVTTKISNRSPSATLPLTGDFAGWTFAARE